MAGETSGPGPSEQEIRMVALERKFDELLSFVQLIAKRNTDDENQRKEDDKDAPVKEGPKDILTPTPLHHRRRHQSQRGKTPSWTARLIAWRRRSGSYRMAPYADNEPLLIQTFQDTLTGHAAEWYSQLKKISHWKELADTFLAQYGFNSQIAPDRFDLQRMEKKSNETFREYAQRWREKAARARPPLDEREMIKIFVDTLKNPYFDRMIGLQMQFFVDLIPVGERIEDALKTKKIVDMTALMALSRTSRQEDSDEEKGRGCANDREKQWKTEASPPNLHHATGIQPRPTPTPAPNSGSSPGPSTPNTGKAEGGVNMVEIEEGGEERISWRRLFYTLEKQRHITPLEAPPGPSTGDACEYHSGARGHSLECCEEFKKKVTDLMEKGSILDDIVEDEMDLDNLQDEGNDWGYFMEDDTDEWRNVDFTKLFQFPCLIVPPGFETPEFEIFYENGDPEAHLQKYGEKMALHLENELLMISVFPESLSKQAAAWFYQLRNLTDGEPYVIPDPGVNEVIVEIKEESSMPSLPALTEGEEEEKAKPLPPAKDPDSIRHCRKRRRASQDATSQSPSNITTTTAEEEYAGPMVEGLSIHTIAEEEDSTTPPTRHCQQGEEAKMWTCVPLLQRVSSSNEITRKTSNDPHVSKIDNKTNCSLDNIDNSDEEIELPNDILEALERQDEGSKPNIEELEIINLADEGEEPREVKIGTRCTTEQKEALIALLREFHEIFAWSYQDMPGLDTDIVVHKIPLKPECKPVKQALRRMKPEVILKIKEEVEKQLKAGFPKHSNLFGLGSQYSPSAEKGWKTTNAVFSFMDGFSGYNQIKMAEEDKSKTAFVTHWGTFVYDVMPFGLKNAGATYQRAMVTLFHDMIHHEIEVYVDDMIAKSRTAQDHLTDLRKLFQRLKKYQLRLNPEQVCLRRHIRKVIRVSSSAAGESRLIPQRFKPYEACPRQRQRKRSEASWEGLTIAFDKIKEYLLNPPILVPPTPGRPLILYLTVQETSMGCMLGQQDETGKKEQAIYYLSKKFTEPETRYLLEFPDEDVMTVDEDNHGRWKLYFDGAANAVGSGIGAVLVSPKGQQTPIAVKLGFDCTNNMTEYEACIVGLQAALEFGAYELEVFGDSLLIVSQTNGEWQARDPKLIPYQRYISRLVPKFKYITFTYTPRAHNHFADALATLASLIKLVEGDDVRPLRIETRDIPGILEYPPRATENEKKYIRRMAFQFFLSGEILYKRTHDATLLRCVDAEEANRLIQEMHAGLMGAHANGPFLARKIMRAARMHLPNISTLWPRRGPFSAWGMDVIGAITPKASNGHEFILVAIDYFTKWVEACSFKNVTQVAVTRFVKNNIICRYGMPEMLITDNASNLNNRMMDPAMPAVQDPAPQLCSIPPKMNGAVEAANKNEEAEWAQARYEQLNFIDEKRLAALCHGQLYQRRIERAYNKKARPRTFQPGDPRSEEEEYGPIRSTRKVRTII
uniref:Uncharacterized protein n=1 Tax=Fagus sylvatica TaxID=28930 RepID=A0A2N9ETJ5_FAGSY